MKLKRSCLLTILWGLMSCSSFQSVEPPKQTIKFAHNVDVTVDNSTKAYEAGKSLEYSLNSPLLVEAEGKVSMLIYPVNTKDNFEVKLPDLDTKKISEVQRNEVNKTMDVLMPEIQQVQAVMLKKDYVNAISKIRDLKTQYPKIAYLSFVEGACYSILNRNSDAMRALEEGLQVNSENATAQELYRKISGRK